MTIRKSRAFGIVNLIVNYFILMESNDGAQRKKRYNRKKNNLLETNKTSERDSNFLKITDGYFFYVFSMVTLLVWLLFLRLPFLGIFCKLLRLKEVEQQAHCCEKYGFEILSRQTDK